MLLPRDCSYTTERAVCKSSHLVIMTDEYQMSEAVHGGYVYWHSNVGKENYVTQQPNRVFWQHDIGIKLQICTEQLSLKSIKVVFLTTK